MKEKITMDTVLFLGARGDISTLKGMSDNTRTPFTVEELRNGRAVMAKHGEDNCRLVFTGAGSDQVVTALYGYDNSDYGECEYDYADYGDPHCTRGPIGLGEPFVEFLDRNGLEMEGVNDAPRAEVSANGPAPEHLPNTGRLEPVDENTPLYLTQMGTITLSPAVDNLGKPNRHFTVARLRIGARPPPVAFNDRMAAVIRDVHGLAMLGLAYYEDDDTPKKSVNFMTYGTLLRQNGLRLVESGR